jgi:GH35 family endo-1,4-beta-xylanase
MGWLRTTTGKAHSHRRSTPPFLVSKSVLAAGAASAAALLAGGTSAEAATRSRAAKAHAARTGDVAWASASLRDLAAGVGLRFGSALIPQDIETPSYAAIAGSQFSVVTPGNGMKWQIVEPDTSPSELDPTNWWIVNAGPEIIPDAFRWAHAADPDALLFYNDYNIGGEDGTNAKSDAVYAYLQQLLADGVPIHGVGNQGHLDTQYGWSPALLRQDLERFASLGLKVAITEADVRTFVNNATDQVPTDMLAAGKRHS